MLEWKQEHRYKESHDQCDKFNSAESEIFLEFSKYKNIFSSSLKWILTVRFSLWSRCVTLIQSDIKIRKIRIKDENESL